MVSALGVFSVLGSVGDLAIGDKVHSAAQAGAGPPCSRSSPTTHAQGHGAGPAAPDRGDRTMPHPFLEREPRGRAAGHERSWFVGGGLIMASKPSTRLAEGGHSAAQAGAGLRQGNTWDPQAASVRQGGGGWQAKEQEGR